MREKAFLGLFLGGLTVLATLVTISQGAEMVFQGREP